MTRRGFLSAVAPATAAGTLVGLAGCIGSNDGLGQLTVAVINEDELTHTVTVTVTNKASDVVESVADEDIEPGVGRTFTSDGYPEDTYVVAVEGDGEAVPAWKQITRWSNLAECPSLVFELRLTSNNGVKSVLASERCESQ